jgi:phosphatidylinositol alpha-1,6-mannosyltransferase
MKTLLISDIFPPKTGGSGRWFWEIYRRLESESLAIAAGEVENAGVFDRGHDLCIHRVPLEMRSRALRSLAGLRGYWRGFRRLWPLVRREKIVRCHAARCLPEGFMALLLKRFAGTSYSCYAHGEELGTASTSRELTWLTRRVLGGCEFVVANSQNTRRILLEEWGFPAERVHVLHPGVDTQRFRPAVRDDRMRDRLGWGSRTVILTVGRLQKRKGHDMLIRALAKVRETVPDILYAIVGDGEEREALVRFADREGMRDHVRFHGEVDENSLVTCYQQCDVFVLPNRSIGKDIEGFGMVLLEAQACGKPVIAGASGGTSETMSIPHTGLVVPCDVPDALAETLVEMLADRDRIECMGDSARKWVAENFDWTALSRQAAQLFEIPLGVSAADRDEEADEETVIVKCRKGTYVV